jgi:hypothetical protein
MYWDVETLFNLLLLREEVQRLELSAEDSEGSEDVRGVPVGSIALSSADAEVGEVGWASGRQKRGHQRLGI